MTQTAISSADQIQRVATLFGKAAMRWRKERESSEIDSDCLPDRLELRPVSSLSVDGRNDQATCPVETDSNIERGEANVVRRATDQDRSADRRSDSAMQSQSGQGGNHQGGSREKRSEGGRR